MKIAYLTNQYPKTSHTFIRREIAGLEELGVAVERFSIRAVDEPLADAQDRAELVKTRVLLAHGALGLLPDAFAVLVSRPRRTLAAFRVAIEMGMRSERGIARHLAYLAEACALLRRVTRLGVDHIHAHFSTNPTDVALLCRELGGPPFSFTAHGTADLGSKSAASITRKIERAAFAVAVCEHGRRELLARAPRGHEAKVHVVRCGVDRRFLSGSASPASACRRLVAVARLSPEKGIDVLLRAASLLKREGLEFALDVLGDGSERAALEQLARELELSSRVRFIGWTSGAEVRAQIVEARALVLASRSEGLPVVIMEALALNRPVIATRVGGIAELVVAGESGWLIAPGSIEELADAMRDALTRSGTELDAMGRSGARRVNVEHDASLQAGKIACLFAASWLERVSLAAVV